MGRKKIENKMACALFEVLRKDSKEKRDLNDVVEKIVKDHPEKTKKFNIEKIKSEALRLLKEYDDKVSEQERKELENKFEEYRNAIEKSIYQWRMGLYRDLTHKNVLSYVDSMEFYLLELARNLNYELDEKSKTYIVPYPDNILDVIYDIREQFYYDYIYGIRQKILDQKDYNNALKQIRGLYDAIEILIGKKPEVKVIKEVKEVEKNGLKLDNLEKMVLKEYESAVIEKKKNIISEKEVLCRHCKTPYKDETQKICENCRNERGQPTFNELMHQRFGTSQRDNIKDMPRYDGTRKLIRSVDYNTVAKYEKKPFINEKTLEILACISLIFGMVLILLLLFIIW